MRLVCTSRGVGRAPVCAGAHAGRGWRASNMRTWGADVWRSRVRTGAQGGARGQQVCMGAGGWCAGLRRSGARELYWQARGGDVGGQRIGAQVGRQVTQVKTMVLYF